MYSQPCNQNTRASCLNSHTQEPSAGTSNINPKMDIRTTVQSNLFQPSRQYSEKPKPITYATKNP